MRTYSFVRSRSSVILNVAVDLFLIIVSVEEADRDVLLMSVHVMSPDAMESGLVDSQSSNCMHEE